MLNKISFSQNKETSKIDNVLNAENGLKVIASGVVGAAAGTGYYHVITKDKFIKEKANIIKESLDDFEYEVQDEIQYKIKKNNPMSTQEIADLRDTYNTDSYYKEKVAEKIKFAKEKSNKLFKKNVRWGVAAGAIVGAAYFGIKSFYKPKNENNIANKEDKNKIVTPENALTLITAPAAGAGVGNIFYKIFQKGGFIKQENEIVEKYKNIVEVEVKETIAHRATFGEEVIGDEIDELRKIKMRRKQRIIKEEVDIAKENSKKLSKKSTKVGLGIGLLIGGAYVGYKKFINKKQKS